uniref:Uncharacterized protein n=1 Tax=Romanomermis culicivorax TaxID=13658 RepID=A0A915K3U4_ROMCU
MISEIWRLVPKCVTISIHQIEMENQIGHASSSAIIDAIRRPQNLENEGRLQVQARDYLQQNNHELGISGCNNVGMDPTSRLSRARDNREHGLESELEWCGCNEFFSLILIATSVTTIMTKSDTPHGVNGISTPPSSYYMKYHFRACLFDMIQEQC